MSLALRKEDERVWTYRDYYYMLMTATEYEIIDGELFMMVALNWKYAIFTDMQLRDLRLDIVHNMC